MSALFRLVLIIVIAASSACSTPAQQVVPAQNLPRELDLWACTLVGHESDVGVGAVVQGQIDDFKFILVDTSGIGHEYAANCFRSPLKDFR
jgi:hypothetical protein